jgi:hypothetical protein
MVEFNKKEKLFNLKGIAVRIYQSYKKINVYRSLFHL